MSQIPGLTEMSPEERELAEAQIRQIQKEIRFDTRDFPVETIVNRFQKDNFSIPPYQREFVWTEEDQSSFVESVIMGLPIPMMFLAEDDDGTFEIVDGAQRIQTLDGFLSDELTLTGLKKLTSLNGFCFSDLPDNQQQKLSSRALRIVILDQETSEESRKDLFERINKFGRALTPSERRRGALEGPFLKFLERCAENKTFMEICPITDKMKRRKEPLELVTRFFAYSQQYKDFKHDVDKFLDDFVKKHQTKFEEARFANEFERTMLFVQKHFPYGFAKSANATTTPRVRFEAIAVGTNLALRENSNLVPVGVQSWIASPEFKQQTTTHASNSSVRLAGRIEFVRDHLLGTAE